MKKLLVILLPVLIMGLATSGCNKNKQKTLGQFAHERFAKVKKSIVKKVDDKEQRDLLLIMAEENRIAYLKIQLEFLKIMRLGRENADISRAELEKMLSRYNDFRTEQFMFMAQNRLKMRKLVNKELWNEIFNSNIPEVSVKQKKEANANNAADKQKIKAADGDELKTNKTDVTEDEQTKSNAEEGGQS
jgi:uncharacterized coiled-coil protein SlyX